MNPSTGYYHLLIEFKQSISWIFKSWMIFKITFWRWLRLIKRSQGTKKSTNDTTEKVMKIKNFLQTSHLLIMIFKSIFYWLPWGQCSVQIVFFWTPLHQEFPFKFPYLLSSKLEFAFLLIYKILDAYTCILEVKTQMLIVRLFNNIIFKLLRKITAVITKLIRRI